MRRLIFIGNCLGGKLAQLLTTLQPQFANYPSLNYQIVSAPLIHNLYQPEEWERQASLAQSCDHVFSQPLFNFGACNTETLQPKLGQRLHLFSAPNFEAYFPDALDIRPYRQKEKFPPPLEWHSRILVQCKRANIRPEEIESVYLHHPLFKEKSVKQAIQKSLERYKKREQGVELGTLDEMLAHYTLEPLFHTWQHPGDTIIKTLLRKILAVLDFPPPVTEQALSTLPWEESAANPHAWSNWSFGFNAWPVITHGHKLFSFPGREFFRIAGMEIDILTAALAWYNWYDAHPENFQQIVEYLEQNS